MPPACWLVTVVRSSCSSVSVASVAAHPPCSPAVVCMFATEPCCRVLNHQNRQAARTGRGPTRRTQQKVTFPGTHSHHPYTLLPCALRLPSTWQQPTSLATTSTLPLLCVRMLPALTRSTHPAHSVLHPTVCVWTRYTQDPESESRPRVHMSSAPSTSRAFQWRPVASGGTCLRQTRGARKG